LSINLSKLKFDPNGLIPAIVQDVENGEVLMMAWMNREAVRKTVETGLTHFYSRSRKKLWQKGETSGHIQKVREVLYDCDADCLLVRAEQVVAACHTGRRSCFFNKLGGGLKGKTVFDPREVYSGHRSVRIVDDLYRVILDRKNDPRRSSYSSVLLSEGVEAIGRKVLEEAGELVEAAKKDGPVKITREAADLVYHALVLLASAGVSPLQVREELASRFGTGGLEEKAVRKRSKDQDPGTRG
jgi:phosphoribosyl-ATP pyrophosphohydrolase/phosphoribosyl-AMP cyclohydrolase